MFEACLPFGPCVTSKETFCPSFSVLKPCIWIAEKCAKRSSLPSSGVMKPYPFASLNHLTVPVAIAPCPLCGTGGIPRIVRFQAPQPYADPLKPNSNALCTRAFGDSQQGEPGSVSLAPRIVRV